jgi:hypothetical protein
MRKILLVLCGLFMVSAFAMAEEMEMAKKGRGFELGLVTPIQLGGREENVDGFRLSTIWTVNQDVKGFDWTWIASKTEGEFNGFKLGGVYNQVDKGGKIYQLGGFVNNYKGEVKVGQVFSGINIVDKAEGFRVFSFVNYAKEMDGIDFGAVNFAGDMKGFQFGLFNYAKMLNGYQVGLINYAGNSSIFPVLPIFNMGK